MLTTQKNSLLVERLANLQIVCEIFAAKIKQQKENCNIDLDKIEQGKLEDYSRFLACQGNYLIPMVYWMHRVILQKMDFTPDEQWAIFNSEKLREMFDYKSIEADGINYFFPKKDCEMGDSKC